MQHISHSICPYCILGLKAGAPPADVEAAYNRLTEALAEDNFMDTPQEWVQAQQAYMAIENAYKRIKEGDEDEPHPECRESEEDEVSIPPKLGQLLVAAGVITIGQLEDAIAQQATVDLPLGEILKRSNLVTQMELDAFLLNQRQIKLPADSPYLIGQRLIGLGLVTEDMVRIALVEQRTTNKPLGRILVERGWLAGDILKVLTYGEEAQVREDQSRIPAN
jgi:chorismate-pyruvate lyase